MFFTYKDFKNYDDYVKSGVKPLSWLGDFDKWFSEAYGVKIMPTYYEVAECRGDIVQSFSVVPYSLEDYRTLYEYVRKRKGDFVILSQDMRDELTAVIEKYIAQYGEPVIKENGCIWTIIAEPYLIGYRSEYLLKHLFHENRPKIEAFFSSLSPVSVSRNLSCFECILKTKEEAVSFIKSREYSLIKDKIYDFFKAYDQYDALSPENIFIFVDYEEHIHEIPMHGRWVGDMNYDDMQKYMNKLTEEL